MVVAQGLYKKLSYKKQTALGTAASGSGGNYLRRETSTWSLGKDTFDANEIVSHQQDTGIAYGVAKVTGSVNGALSGGTYAPFLGSLLRKDFVATAAVTGRSITIAGSGPYTLTDGTATWLTSGLKIGDVIRITAGTYTGTARDINLLITGVTQTVITVVVVNGSTLTAQGPIATSTVTVIGKKSLVPTSGHTNDYYTFEEWFNDISKSRTYTDVQVGSADIGMPSKGNATIGLNFLGLGRTKGASQVLTTPTAETTSQIFAAVNGYILVNGTRVLTMTSASVKIDGQVQHGEAVIGSKFISDLVKGDVMVTGSFSALHDGETISDLFANETTISLMFVITTDATAAADFVTVVIPAVKLKKDDTDDGKKQIVASYDFTAGINSSGGAALASDQTIVSIQDSLA